MATLNMLRKWLDGSYWSSALVEAGITTSGRAAAHLSSCHVKCSHYAHQVTVSLLFTSFRSKLITTFVRSNQYPKNHLHLKWRATAPSGLLLEYCNEIRIFDVKLNQIIA